MHINPFGKVSGDRNSFDNFALVLHQIRRTWLEKGADLAHFS